MAESTNNPTDQPSGTRAEVKQVLSIVWAVIASAAVMLLLLLPIGFHFAIPNFKSIFDDMLGESLPALTRLVLYISDMFRDNTPITLILLPVYLLLSLACAGFIGFHQYLSPKPVFKIVRVILLVLCIVWSVCPAIGMFWPLIKMMDKLGR